MGHSCHSYFSLRGANVWTCQSIDHLIMFMVFPVKFPYCFTLRMFFFLKMVMSIDWPWPGTFLAALLRCASTSPRHWVGHGHLSLCGLLPLHGNFAGVGTSQTWKFKETRNHGGFNHRKFKNSTDKNGESLTKNGDSMSKTDDLMTNNGDSSHENADFSSRCRLKSGFNKQKRWFQQQTCTLNQRVVFFFFPQEKWGYSTHKSRKIWPTGDSAGDFWDLPVGWRQADEAASKKYGFFVQRKLRLNQPKNDEFIGLSDKNWDWIHKEWYRQQF